MPNASKRNVKEHFRNFGSESVTGESRIFSGEWHKENAVSLEIVVTLTCDTCGAILVSSPVFASTRANQAWWSLKSEAKQRGWQTINRGRFLTPTHYCPDCLDKPMKKVPRKKKVTP
jgi:hypothetical protein